MRLARHLAAYRRRAPTATSAYRSERRDARSKRAGAFSTGGGAPVRAACGQSLSLLAMQEAEVCSLLYGRSRYVERVEQRPYRGHRDDTENREPTR